MVSNSKKPVEGWACRRERTIRGTRRQQVSVSSSSRTEEEDGGQRSPLTSASTATVVAEGDHHRPPSENDENKNTNITSSPQHRFVCEICGKGFDIHQALGGHKTIHRIRLSQPRCGGSDEAGPSGSGGETSHSCKKCGASFKTGQQLGGHMRKHYPVNKKTQNLLSQMMISTDGGSSEEAVPNGGADVSRDGGADVERPATEEIDLELRLGF